MKSRQPIGYVVQIDGPEVTLNLLDMHRGQVASHLQGISPVTEVGSLLALDAGSRVTHDLKPGRHAWLHVAEGEILVNDKALTGGDSAAISESRLELQGQKAAQVLLFDLN